MATSHTADSPSSISKRGQSAGEKASPSPGPWRTDGDGIRAIVRAADLTIVCLRHRLPGDIHEANARLIAAAPELLADHIENARILRLLVNELQGRVEGGKLAALMGCLERSDTAISKATGTAER